MTTLLKQDVAYFLYLASQDQETGKRCVRTGGCYKLKGPCADCDYLITDTYRQDIKRVLQEDLEELYADY